jgi:hypothetical protein
LGLQPSWRHVLLVRGNVPDWGFDPQQGPPDRDTAWQRIHPDDLSRISENAEKAQGGVELVHDHRIVLPDGTVKHLQWASANTGRGATFQFLLPGEGTASS